MGIKGNLYLGMAFLWRSQDSSALSLNRRKVECIKSTMETLHPSFIFSYDPKKNLYAKWPFQKQTARDAGSSEQLVQHDKNEVVHHLFILLTLEVNTCWCSHVAHPILVLLFLTGSPISWLMAHYMYSCRRREFFIIGEMGHVPIEVY